MNNTEEENITYAPDEENSTIFDQCAMCGCKVNHMRVTPYHRTDGGANNYPTILALCMDCAVSVMTDGEYEIVEAEDNHE